MTTAVSSSPKAAHDSARFKISTNGAMKVR
jgi:hypothetical protein